MKLPFKEFNANPKGKKTGDCVIRSLCVALNKDYYEVYEELYNISKKTGFMINEKRVYDKLLEAYGFIKMKQPRKNNGTKYDVDEIRLICNSPVIVISIANHLTVVKDGVLIDLWNCGYKTINNYYIKG